MDSEVVIYVDEKTLEDIDYIIDSVLLLFAFLILIPIDYAYKLFSPIHISLAFYVVFSPVLIGSFVVVWLRYKMYSDLDFSFLGYAVVFVLIFLAFNIVAFFFWFSMPRASGVSYSDFYYLEFSSFLADSAIISFLSVFFLKSLLDFGLWVQGRLSDFPFIFAHLKRPKDSDYYVVYVNVYQLYIAFGIIFFEFLLHSWYILTYLYITVFTLLYVLLVIYAIPMIYMLNNDTIKEMLRLRAIIVPRTKENAE